jgi:hypothetical protein
MRKSLPMLPTTTMIVAKTVILKDGINSEKIAGTISLVKDDAFGLPTFKGTPKEFGRIVEVTEFAVAQEFQLHAQFIREQLLKYAYSYALNYMKINTVVVPELNSKILSEFELRKQDQSFSEVVIARWPEREFQKLFDPISDADFLEYFYSTRTILFNEFSLQQKVKALSLFLGSPYVDLVRQILEMETAPAFTLQRASTRFETRLAGQVFDSSGNTMDAIITHVSRKGLALELSVVVDKEYFQAISEVRVQLTEDLCCCLQVKPVSFQNFKGNERGFAIIDADKVWFNYIYYLTQDTFPQRRSAA